MKRADTYHFLRSLRSTAVLVVATAALLASVLTSCSKQAEEPAPVLRDGQIHIDAVIASSPQSASRAPIVDGGTGNKATLTDIRLLREDGTAAATTFSSFATATPIFADRAASGALSFTPAQYYKTDNSTASYIAVYPQGEVLNNAIGQGLKWTIDGATDILISKVYDAGKYSAPASGTTMVFEHHLAQLRVICTADPSVALNVVQAVWGKITKIELLNAWQNYLFYSSENPYNMGGSGDTTISLWNPGYGSQTLGVILGNYTTHCAAGMFGPKSSTTPLRLRVSSSVGAAVEVDVQLKNDAGVSRGFEAGKIHTVTLTFGAADKPIAVTTTSIQNWDEGGTGSGDGIVFEDVYAPSDGIIDMNYAELVKTGTVSMGQYTATPTRRSYNPNTYAASNADNNGGYEGASNQAIVEPAYYKFEVAKADEAGRMDWATAWAACKKKAPVGAWRLPRIMELVLMGFNKAELEKTPGFTPLDDLPYMSGKEEKASSVWLMRYPFISSGAKTTAYDVRCVRELDLSLPAVEDYYYSDGTFSRDLHPTKTVEGVIYWIDPDNGKHFKIVSMDEPPANWDGGTNVQGQLTWGPASGVETGALDLSNGKANTLTIMKNTRASEHPAARWCYARNTGVSVPALGSAATTDANYKWYLPAAYELEYLFCAHWGITPRTWSGSISGSAAAGYPKAWTDRFATLTPFTTDGYWASTDDFHSSCWAVRFSNTIAASNSSKSNNYHVRCVREITL